MCIR